ncbi:hypothetical protein [Streptomyces sp. NPDC049881]|uniref:AMIN-like domain-containing (lipo)protein n=1 Tax=Streptomyces sp. NPDC049881 TaxID=3155778 RepID=UPI003437B506
MRRYRELRYASAVLGLAALLATTACGSTEETAAADTSGWDTERKDSADTDPWQPTVLTRVEAEERDGHDTLTFTFEEGAPHWIVTYEDPLYPHGGEDPGPLDLPGAYDLRVVLVGTTADADTQLEGTTGTVRGLAHAGHFEGETHFGVGVEGDERPAFEVVTGDDTLTVRIARA